MIDFNGSQPLASETRKECPVNRRSFVGATIAAMSLTGKLAGADKVRAGDIPTTTFGKTDIKVSVIAQGGARMDLHPDVQSAAAHVRRMYEIGVSYFDCSRLYWDCRAEEAYGIGLEGVRKNVFLTSKSVKRTAKEANEDLQTSFRLLKTDYLDLWQIHAVGNQQDIDQILGPGGQSRHLKLPRKQVNVALSDSLVILIPRSTRRW